MSDSLRKYSLFDYVLINIDQGVRTLLTPPVAVRPNPADIVPASDLIASERRRSAGLMRVNHAGEISAQALYQGQALTARSPQVRERMQQSAVEENDHLVWCKERLEELGTHTSYLNPAWYLGSLLIGVLAGLAGDKWSLGFIAETERQVVNHLTDHLHRLPEQDQKSRYLIEQMREDEGHHATVALEAGAAELPKAVRTIMSAISKIMTTTAYWV